ncbi:MAG: hypothetical protein ACPG1A_16090, partial [Halioglobus sp.]
IMMPDCDEPTPLILYIHGGGFTGGDKSGGYDRFQGLIEEAMQSCVAFAGINYFLLEVPSDDADRIAAAEQGGVLTSLQDAARALQFLRYHHQSLNIDPENVASFGGSAGAGASLWLGTHDDMADPESADPVLRESTRLKAVGAIATQATYDLLDWEDILLPVTEPLSSILGGTDVVTIAGFVGATNYLLTFFGIPSVEDIDTPEHAAWRANVDMLEMMDAGDAPVYTENFTTGFDDPLNMFLHHATHAIAVKERADAVGLHNVSYSRDPGFPMADPSGENLASFLIRHIR